MSGCQVNASQDCNFTCQSGGTWYACDDSVRFVGCCASDPCGNAGCPTEQLYPASFNADIYNETVPNDCQNGLNAEWYTCAKTTPTFIGCCANVNPCGLTSGCPQASVVAAEWSTKPGQLQFFLDGQSISSSVAASSTSTSSSSQETSSPTTSSTAQVSSAPAHSGLSKGAIGGIAGGAAVVVILILILVAILIQKNRQNSGQSGVAQVNPLDVGTGGTYYGQKPSMAPKTGTPGHTRNYSANTWSPGSRSTLPPYQSPGADSRHSDIIPTEETADNYGRSGYRSHTGLGIAPPWTHPYELDSHQRHELETPSQALDRLGRY